MPTVVDAVAEKGADARDHRLDFTDADERR
jgi:hypothetical protein